MDESFDGLRRYVNSAVRQPDFAVVRVRARRLRRRRTIVTGAVTAVLLLLGLGYAVQAAPHRRGQPARPMPVPTSSLPQLTVQPGADDSQDQVVAGGPHDLYALLGNCFFCADHLYASTDDGATWQRRTLPPPPKGATDKTRASEIYAIGPGLLGLTEWPPGRSGNRPASELIPYRWVSIDGGRTWRRPQVETTPMAGLAPGTAPIGCSFAGPMSPCLIYGMDPATGRIAPLATQPSGIVSDALALYHPLTPVGAGAIYLPGLDPASWKPAIASSTDGGRTWRTTVMVDGYRSQSLHDASKSTMVWPRIVAGAGGTAYADVPRAGPPDLWYRTTDGGQTWQFLTTGDCTLGFVTADGAYICPRPMPDNHAYLISWNGGPFEPYPYSVPPVWISSNFVRQAAAGVFVSPDPRTSVYLSQDGVNWRVVGIP